MIGYEMHGSGAEKVLVFHGWGLDHSAFAFMYPALDAQTFTFAFMDYRGCGLSKNQNGLLSIEEIGKDAIDLADHLKWNTFHLIGHSMGGMVLAVGRSGNTFPHQECRSRDSCSCLWCPSDAPGKETIPFEGW